MTEEKNSLFLLSFFFLLRTHLNFFGNFGKLSSLEDRVFCNSLAICIQVKMLATHLGHLSYAIDYSAKIFKLVGQLSSMPSVFSVQVLCSIAFELIKMCYFLFQLVHLSMPENPFLCLHEASLGVSACVV